MTFLIPALCLGLVFSTPPVFSPGIQGAKAVERIRYGFHYEEIGMMGEGGLHAELVRNRGFEEANPPQGHRAKDGFYLDVPGKKPVYEIDPLVGWEAAPQGVLQLRLTTEAPLTPENPHALRVELPSGGGEASLYNRGFLGMGFHAGETYRLRLWARNVDFEGQVSLSLATEAGEDLSLPLPLPLEARPGWQAYSLELTAPATCAAGGLRFRFRGRGGLLLDMVSLFPTHTYGGTSIFRADILSQLKAYAPDFLRFPGGCIVHGTNVQTQYQWKTTLGPIEHRPGGWSKWEPHYRSDGLGYHEFLELCEALGAQAMYVCPTGMICTGWVFRDVKNPDTLAFKHPQVEVEDYVQDVLDAVEYALGDPSTPWGSRRAQNGHPDPFPLAYVEIGNEDFGELYYERYAVLAQALRRHWPGLKLIANSPIGKQRDNKQIYLPAFKDLSQVDIYDEHYYDGPAWATAQFDRFEAYDRGGPDLFIGELGIGPGYPTGPLAEAVVKLALEKNGDLRPLFAERPMMRHYGFVGNKPPLPLLLHNGLRTVPTYKYYLSRLIKDNPYDLFLGQGAWLAGPVGPGLRYSLFATCGQDCRRGDYVVKLINLSSEPAALDLDLGALHPGVFRVETTVLQASRTDFNTPDNPGLTAPVTEVVEGAPARQVLALPPGSFTLLRATAQ